jgi:hypothetical protein
MTDEVKQVAWQDFLEVCEERGIPYEEGIPVSKMKEMFLANLDKVVPDSEEENNLSQKLVDIQTALVDKAVIIGGPDEPNPPEEKAKKGGKKKETKGKNGKKKEEKSPKTPKPPKTKETVKKETKPSKKGLCRDLWDEGKTEKEILEIISEMYLQEKTAAGEPVPEGFDNMKAYGLERASRIYYDIYREKNEGKSPKPPRGEAMKKAAEERRAKEKKEEAPTTEPVGEEKSETPS